MPMLALKAHFDGKTVVLDEPCHLPPSTPVVVVFTGEPETQARSSRGEAFLRVFGAMKGRIGSSTEFMARKKDEKAIEDRPGI